MTFNTWSRGIKSNLSIIRMTTLPPGRPGWTVAVLWLRKDDYRIENKRFGRRKAFFHELMS